MKKYIFILATIFLSIFISCKEETAKVKSEKMTKNMKALIIDGQNNHGVWPMTTMMMKDYLEETNLFEVDIQRTPNIWLGPHYDKTLGIDEISDLLAMYPLEGGESSKIVKEPEPVPTFNPDFEKYDLVVSNLGWKAATWPDETKANFEKYMAEGGGLIVIHAANNSWGDWEEYNKMIGVGGWGGRNEESGVYVSYDYQNNFNANTPEDGCGSHGPQSEFVMKTRASEHPIMKGLPEEWLHTKDELYEKLCGPGENLTVLATAYSDIEANSPPWNKKVKASGNHEPLLMAIEYGKGRVFHSALGHMDYSMECVGFITTFQRGAEWAATGSVTQAVPDDFPSKEKTSTRDWTFQ